MAYREHRDVLQQEIATAIGVSVTQLSRWERGEREPREPEVLKLAQFFGVTPYYLRYGVNPGGVPEVLRGAKKLTDAQIARAVAIAERAKPSEETEPVKRTKRKPGGAA